MARSIEKEKARNLRSKGHSYSMIKAELGISKSTLSGWLKDLPLSDKRISELQSNSEIRIEKNRITKQNKKDARRKSVYQKVAFDIENSKDPEFVAGFYLYWGEGTKSAEYSIALTNTDPAIIKCFVDWLYKFKITPNSLKIKLHLYTDQNEAELKKYWSKITGVPMTNYYKSYQKTTSSKSKSYKGMFSHGTCSVIYHERDTYEYVLEGIKYLRTKYSV
ncbi:hypothetical protein K2P47_04695 [Patescibacteria group bacterium]|nr:hypothetical protein [Patescibacteria group bacterium]